MPYPDKPHAPRPTAGPNDCQAAKAALIESYDEAEARFNDAFARLKDLAAEIAETNPTAAAYHERRADWCDYLARRAETPAVPDEPEPGPRPNEGR